MIWPMIAMGWVVNLMQRGSASFERIWQMMQERPSIAEGDTSYFRFTVIETVRFDSGSCNSGRLFTDIEMPGSMSGLDLADRVAERWPHIRLVITSGRSRLTNQEVPDAGRFVPKPYFADQVLHAFERADAG